MRRSNMTLEMQLGEATPGQPLDYTWPGGDTEHFEQVWDIQATHDGRSHVVRHGLGRRHVFGSERLHSVTWVDGYPWLQAAAVDDYDSTHELAGFVKLPDGTRAIRKEQIPAEYGDVPVVE